VASNLASDPDQASYRPDPSKRPKSSYIRFEAEQPNETWQSDFTHYRLARTDGRPGTDVEIISWLDDHSRYALYLSLKAMNVLTILQGAEEPLQPMVIAERLMVTRGTLTGIVGSLESRGYVVRAQHERDGRGQLVLLTKLGERTVRKLRPRMHRAEKSLVRT